MRALPPRMETQVWGVNYAEEAAPPLKKQKKTRPTGSPEAAWATAAAAEEAAPAAAVRARRAGAGSRLAKILRDEALPDE